MIRLILKLVTAVDGFVFILAASCLDSISWIPAIVAGATLSWLAAYAYANNWFDEEEFYEDY